MKEIDCDRQWTEEVSSRQQCRPCQVACSKVVIPNTKGTEENYISKYPSSLDQIYEKTEILSVKYG